MKDGTGCYWKTGQGDRYYPFFAPNYWDRPEIYPRLIDRNPYYQASSSADRQPSGATGRPGDLPVPLTRRLAGSHHRLAERANSLGVARDLLCLEHLNRTCAPAGWPQRMPSRKSRL